MKDLFIVSAVGLALTLATPTMAEPSGHAAAANEGRVKRADVLFEAGKLAFKANDVAAAVKSFEASQELDTSASTQMWLARCWVRQGALARALAAYETASTLNEQLTPINRRDALGAQIQKELKELEPRVAILTVVLEPQGVDAVVSLDDARLVGDATLVDPGIHQLSATAAGFKPLKVEIQLQPGRAVAHLRLEPAVAERDPVGPMRPAEPDRGARQGVPKSTKPAPRILPSPPEHGTKRKIAIGLLGSGVVAGGMAAYFGVHTLVLVSDAACDGNDVCSPAGGATIEEARREQTRGFVAVGVSALLLGIGGYLFFDSAPRPRNAQQNQLRLGLSTHGPMLQGTW